MKTTYRSEQAANLDFGTWEKAATEARKQIECAFKILKNRFGALQSRFRLQHECQIGHFILACDCLLNLCIDNEQNMAFHELRIFLNRDNIIVSTETDEPR